MLHIFAHISQMATPNAVQLKASEREIPRLSNKTYYSQLRQQTYEI